MQMMRASSQLTEILIRKFIARIPSTNAEINWIGLDILQNNINEGVDLYTHAFWMCVCLSVFLSLSGMICVDVLHFSSLKR